MFIICCSIWPKYYFFLLYVTACLIDCCMLLWNSHACTFGIYTLFVYRLLHWIGQLYFDHFSIDFRNVETLYLPKFYIYKWDTLYNGQSTTQHWSLQQKTKQMGSKKKGMAMLTVFAKNVLKFCCNFNLYILVQRSYTFPVTQMQQVKPLQDGNLVQHGMTTCQ